MKVITSKPLEPSPQFFSYLAVFLWAALIFTFSSMSQIKVSQFILWDFIAKKSAHVIEYAILFVLIFRATKGKWSLSYFLLILYAVSDEFHQKFVPGRSSSPLDIGFDATGANIASYIIWKLSQRRKARPSK